MKLTIKKDLLLENLNKVSKAISTKNLIPILAGIKFELKEEGLTLTASDNDITIQTFIPVNNEEMTIEKEGIIIIQGKYILDIVRKLPDEFINIEVIDDLKILISTQNSEFNFDGWNDNSTNYQIENITKDDKTYNRYIRYVEVNSTDLYTFVAILSKKIIHINNETTKNIPTMKDMADELKTKFSGVKNTTLSDSNQNANDIIKGKIGNSSSLGGAIYQGKSDASKNNRKVKVILSDENNTESTETIVIDINDDITSLDSETNIVLNESPVIREIINVTTQNVGKIEINNEDDTSNYDENFNKIVSKTTKTFNTPQIKFNNN
jgi:hypothetical protein